jgi:hypothetical protein
MTYKFPDRATQPEDVVRPIMQAANRALHDAGYDMELFTELCSGQLDGDPDDMLHAFRGMYIAEYKETYDCWSDLWTAAIRLGVAVNKQTRNRDARRRLREIREHPEDQPTRPYQGS